MTDNELIDHVATQLEAAVASGAWDYLVIQKSGPDKEGIPTGPAVFFQKIGDHRYGHQMVKHALILEDNEFNEKNIQIYETTFQISAMAIQKPEDITLPTASDVANHICMFMQSRTTIAALGKVDISVLRVTAVRNPYIVDDHIRFEAQPNFDLIVYSKREIDIKVPAVSKAVGAFAFDPTIPGEGVFVVKDAEV